MAEATEELFRDANDVYQDLFHTNAAKVLARVLRWHYNGGNVNYYTYLESMSFFEKVKDLHPTQKYYLKYHEPEDYDFESLLLLIHFTCNIFRDRKYKDKNHHYETLCECIHAIMKEADASCKCEEVLSDSQVAEKLHNSFLLFFNTLRAAAEIADVPEDEYLAFSQEMKVGFIFHPGFLKPPMNPEDGPPKVTTFGKAFQAIIANTLQEVVREDNSVDSALVDEVLNSVLSKREKKENQTINELFPSKMFEGKFKSESQKRSLKFESKMSKKLSTQRTKALPKPNFNSKKQHQYDVDTKPIVEADSVKTDTKPSQVGNDAQSKLPVEIHSEIDTTAKQLEDDSASSSEIDDGVSSESKEIDFSECEDNSDEIRNTNIDNIEVSLKPILATICTSLYESTELPIRGEIDPPSSLYSCQGVILKQHQKYSQKPGQVVELSSLLSVKGMDDNEAQIILLSGEPGMGKSWVLNYIPKIYKAGMCDDGTFKFLFSCQLGNNGCSSILQLVADACKEQVENVDAKEDAILNEMLKYPTLILLDGYHDMYKSCQHLVREVLNMTETNLRVVIACRPHYVDHIYALIPKKRKKHVCHLRLGAVPPSLHADFVSRILDHGEVGLNADVKLDLVKQGLISQLPLIYDIIGVGMCNPLMLQIITNMWTENTNVCQ